MNNHILSIIISLSKIRQYVVNSLISPIPSHTIRLVLYRLIGGMRIGKDSSISLYCTFLEPWNIRIGNNVAINQSVFIDARGGVDIGSNVNIGRSVYIYTGSHEYNKPGFDYLLKRVNVCDDAWIASNSVILPGVIIGKGSVTAAGSVVTKSTEPHTVVGGNPAKKIKDRIIELDYKTRYFEFLY